MGAVDLPIIAVAPYMVIEVAFGSERLTTAVCADVWALLAMNHLVELQVVSLSKGLIASWEGTLKRLFTCMKVEVRL